MAPGYVVGRRGGWGGWGVFLSADGEIWCPLVGNFYCPRSRDLYDPLAGSEDSGSVSR